MIEQPMGAGDQWFRTIFDSVNDAIFIHDFPSGVILDVNARMCEMYGYTRQEALQLTIGDLSQDQPPYTQQDALDWIYTIPLGESRLNEWRARHKNGGLFWVEINVRHTEIDGKERLLVTVRNIDERKKAEQMRTALYRISDAAHAAMNPADFYQLLHAVIRTLMPARNFYIALFHQPGGVITIPFHSEEGAACLPPEQPDKSLAAYILRQKMAILITPARFKDLVAEGLVEPGGTAYQDWLGAPLNIAQDVIGVMVVKSHLPEERLTQEDCEALSLVSNQVALMLAHQRAEEHERKLTQGLRAVIEIADELIRCDRLDTVYRRAVELAREKLDLERCGLFLLDTSREYLVGTYGTDNLGKTTDEHLARVPVSRHPEIFNEVEHFWSVLPRDYAYWIADQHILMDTGWVVSTVIRDNAQPIGVFYNDTAITHTPLDQAVQETVATFCSRLGNIIQRKRMEVHERDTLQRLEAIVACADELIRCEDLDTVYRRAVELSREKLHIERCSIFMLDETGKEMIGTYGTDANGNTTDERDVRWPVSARPEIFSDNEQNRLIRTDDLQSYWEKGVQKTLSPGWIAFTLIRFSKKPIGLFCNDAAITHSPTDNSVQETIAIYTSLLGNIIQRMRVEVDQKELITELETKNTELERFAYTVSHDLKAPLITIRGFLGFIEKDAAANNLERLEADIARISEATNKMQRLLHDLLELSRIGRLMNPSQVLSFEDITRDAIHILTGQIEACGAQIKLQSGLPQVYGDRVRLVEVMQNLLDNAVKFSNYRVDPQIEIGARLPDETGKPVLYVKDNGLGIDPQYHERIFGLFNKLDTKRDGTGVGLALVKRIIELHGGRIWVESDGKEQGSTFCFTLPEAPPN